MCIRDRYKVIEAEVDGNRIKEVRIPVTSILYKLTPLYYIMLFIGVIMWVYGIVSSKSPRKTGALSFGLFILGFILVFLI